MGESGLKSANDAAGDAFGGEVEADGEVVAVGEEALDEINALVVDDAEERGVFGHGGLADSAVVHSWMATAARLSAMMMGRARPRGGGGDVEDDGDVFIPPSSLAAAGAIFIPPAGVAMISLLGADGGVVAELGDVGGFAVGEGDGADGAVGFGVGEVAEEGLVVGDGG